MRFHYKYSLLTCILVAYLSLKNIDIDLPSTYWIPHADKLVHLVMYILLGVACSADSRAIMSKFGRIFLCPIFPILYGGMMELLQEYYFPPRTGEWADFAFDAIGVLIGWGITEYLINYIQKRR